MTGKRTLAFAAASTLAGVLVAAAAVSGANTAPERTNAASLGRTVDVDAIFGSGTEQAVVDYQEQAGLEADGIVGNATWSALQVGNVG